MVIDPPASMEAFAQALRLKLQTHGVRIPMRGNSMAPTIKHGQKVIIIRKMPDEIEPGDIALFVTDDRIFLHRIIYKEKVDNATMFLTRGDNCQSLDNWIVHESMMIGVVDSCDDAAYGLG